MKHFEQFTLVSGLLLSCVQAQASDGNITLAARTNTSSSTACADVHYFVVRASLEAPGQGIIGTLATLSSAQFPGSSVEAINYPALLDPYANSSANGTATLTQRMKNYIDGCDKAKIVLLGYSQGAHVVGDVLCGGGDPQQLFLGPQTPPIDKKYADKVVAMIQMGDPRFVANKSFDVGSATTSGLFVRPADISCDPYASKIQSYCDNGDPYCASGNISEVHANYTRKYNTDANKFIMDKLMAAGVKMGGSTASDATHLQLGSSILLVISVLLPLLVF